MSGLSQALPYLIAAKTVDISEELAEGQEIAKGEEGAAVVSGLGSFSKKLANGQSTSKVKVINIYADKNGKLDEKQLKKAFSDKVIDVTDQYVLVNVIAASADQALSFSGYSITNNGETVSYEDATQAGDILYNFAALSGDSFKEYKGTLKLTGSLRGTFLAPGAQVEVQANLSGAVYASKVEAASGVTELKRIVLINGSPEEEQDTEDTETEDTEDSETEAAETEELAETSETEETTEVPGTEETAETEELTDATETEGLAEAEELTDATETEESAEATGTEESTEASETEELTDVAETTRTEEPAEASETEELTDAAETTETTETEEPAEASETEELTDASEETSDTENLTEASTEAAEASQTETEAETPTAISETEVPAETAVTLPETEITIETEAALPETGETEAFTDTEITELGETEAADVPSIVSLEDEEEILVAGFSMLTTRSLQWYSETGISMAVRLTDAEDTSRTPLKSGKVVVKAAENIYDDNGNLVFAKDGEAAAYNWAGTSQNGALVLNYGGSYYLEVTEVPEYYLMPSRIYFKVDATGALVVESGTGWFGWENNLLTIPLQKSTQAQVILSLTAEDQTTQLTGAAFVLKDSGKAVIRNEEGQPKYYINYNGAAVGLQGLAPGTYYLSQIKAGTNPANTQEKYQVAEDTQFVIGETVTAPVELSLTNTRVADSGKSLTVSARSLFNSVALTAEKEQQTYLALYSDAEHTRRVSEVKSLSYKAGAASTDSAVFEGLADGTYYLGATDEFGEAPAELTYSLRIEDKDAAVTFSPAGQEGQKEETQKTAVVDYVYGTYPSGDFSYEAEIQVTMTVKDKSGSDKKTSEIFYADLYSDSQLTKTVLTKPLVFEMKKSSSQTVTAKVKMTEATGELYVAETDKNGKLIDASLDTVKYTITAPAQLAVTCGQTVTAEIQNQLKASVVKIRVEDSASGKILSGAQLVLKDKKTGAALSINKIGVFNSDSADIVREDIPVGTYILSEITAPSGYTCTPDVEFTVEEGLTVEVVLKNTKTVATGYSLTVLKQVYCGDKLLYARDTTSGQYASEGRYTFYAALFSDAAHTKKVSDVRKITVSGLGGTTQFKNLTAGGTYYVAETNAYGVAVTSYKGFTVSYNNGGKVTMSSTAVQAVIKNSSESLPTGYRHTATLTLTKKLQTAAGDAEAATKSFYAGIYRTADYSDTPTIVELNLKNASEVSTTRRILLSGSQSMTYYIAEVDANGNRITDSSDFGYTVSIDQPTVTLSGGDAKNVTITNKTKVTKVTLYLTKRVYQGTTQKAVNETFYAGLFKDAEFTQLYANPIPLKLENKSEITLKLSLNLGSASEATIYVAEVDKDGKLVKEGKSFGYDVRVINSTVAFTQERTEIQSVLMNSVYGSTSAEGWGTIAAGTNPIGGTGGSGLGGSGGSTFYNNGSSSGGTSSGSSVKTGDDTPILPYAAALAGSAVVLAGVFLGIQRKKKSR